jgi:hypothetical protein
MVETRGALAGLRNHFELLKRTGSQPRHLHFEDSDICCRSPFFSCRTSRCVLMEFVPEQFRSTATPCRYIPLNEKGEGLEVLYRTRTTGDTESVVTAWLSSMIETLESLMASEEAGRPSGAA